MNDQALEKIANIKSLDWECNALAWWWLVEQIKPPIHKTISYAIISKQIKSVYYETVQLYSTAIIDKAISFGLQQI